MTDTLAAGPLTLTLHWNGQTLASTRLSFGGPEVACELTSPSSRLLQKVLEDYVQGRDIAWPQIDFDLTALTAFSQSVLRELARIPRGQVKTYAELAALCGRPRAARAVGNVMAANPYPLLLPCHRVLASGGGLGGFGPGLEAKRYLLGLEGVLHKALGN